MDPTLYGGLRTKRANPVPTDLISIAAWRERSAIELAEIERVRPHSALVVSARYRVASSDGSMIPVRVFRAIDATGRVPVLLWLHGGGMIGGSVDRDSWYCEGVVEAVGCAVVAVDYRLAPEFEHPTQSDDAYAALRWVMSTGGGIGLDVSRLAVGGASAGGGIAAGLAIRNRDDNGAPICFQYLAYPMLDDRELTVSSRAFSGIPTWGSEQNRNGWLALLGNRRGTANVDPRAAPARANELRGLPSSLIQVGELDTFRDEDIEYGMRLMQAGVSTELHVYPGAYHGWDTVNPGATSAMAVGVERDVALRRALKIR